jgi:ribonuclease E
MLMPSHVKKVVEYKDPTPLFIKEDIETQIEEMHSPNVQLKSGGYLVINPTEALISIDVNSGRSTKERNIEDTALRTNLEAATEVARQLKLRDLGGLVVIDFIDMEKRSFNNKVEKAMRDALAGDRARIQIGRISSFGLMEMSRQRLHPSLTETHFETCPHCIGMGIVKTVDTLALAILRAIEESALKKNNANITVTMENDVALYLLNNRRQSLNELENRYNISVIVEIGHAEDGARFALESIKKPADQDDETVDNAPEPIAENASDDAEDKAEANKKRQPRRRKPSNKSDNTQKETQNQNEKTDKAPKKSTNNDDKKESAQSDNGDDARPAPRRRKKAVKKVDIVDVSDKGVEEKSTIEDAQKPKAKKAAPKKQPKVKKDTDSKDKSSGPATNDNKDAKETKAAENIAAAEAEIVNKAPKSKKKGWWNKIIES